nr:uncharacterized protein LOC113729430 [Coffea arabica]
MNVEICSTIKLVKYLYKYVYKGHDRVSFHIYSENNPGNIDEMKDFQTGRWVAAAEAFWCIYKFNLNEMTPAVYTLQLHLPEFFVWKPTKKKWIERKRKRVIGRVVTVAPNEGERYYLRLLLSHVHAFTCFEDLLTVNGKLMLSYREAVFQIGLLQSDTHMEDTLNEAAAFQMSSSLRTLFAILLAYCSPSNPKVLWEKYETEIRDFEKAKSFSAQNVEQIRRCVLLDINKSLEQMGKNVNDYHLVPGGFILNHDERLTREIQSELSIQFTEQDLLLPSKLNIGQRFAYGVIL